MARHLEVDCCVVGGGPAGIMAGLLFARAGCKTLVLEKHKDFLRDFRGDTVHPSSMELLEELGLLDAFLQRPHQKLSQLTGKFDGKIIHLTDFSSLSVKAKFIAFMPQWHFLDFLSGAAKSLPGFDIEMQAEAKQLLFEDERVVGVSVDTVDGSLEVRAKLTIGADGRGSALRQQAGLEVEDLGAPIDVLWFHVPKTENGDDEPLLNSGGGNLVITIDRGDYYQCALVIAKGGAEAIRAGSLDAFKERVVAAVPKLIPNIDAVKSFDDVKLLTVKVDRLNQWAKPGLVMIGDSAHAMSPIGGVGINLAIQDAVAAANLLSGPLADGELRDDMLPSVRKTRLWAVRVTQFIQVQAQNRLVAPMVKQSTAGKGVPTPLKIISRIGFLRKLMARFVGIGVRAEHIRSPERHKISL